MAKRCVFCGGKGPFNDEHVWPDWIGRLLFGYKKGDHAPSAPHQRSSSVPSESDGEWTKPSFTTITRAICAECNGGWMAELETAVQPILTPMLLGKRTILNESDQTILAQWIAKTGMTFQLTTPRKPIPARHFKYLFDHRLPPPSSQIWSGIRTAEDGVIVGGLQSSRIQIPSDKAEEVFHRGYLVSFGIGLFVGQFFGNDLPRFDFRWGHEGVFANAVEQIWPFIETIEWPPKQAIRSIEDFGKDPAFEAHLVRALGDRGVILKTIRPE